jgi:urease gamma subunit
VHLTPREHERLLLAAAADLARRRLARGAPLGATEAVALICDEVCELAWDGVPLPEVIARARAVIPPAALLPGVAGLIPVIEVEALFPWGSTLVHVDAPFADDPGPGAEVPWPGQEQAETERARLTPGTARSPASGPGEPGTPGRPGERARPSEPASAGEPGRPASAREPGRPASASGPTAEAGPAALGARYGPGAVLPAAGAIELAAGAERRAALLRNTGPRDVWISSHFPLGELNPAVRVRWAGREGAVSVPDDALAPEADSGDARAGPRPPWRLDLPAGEALLLRAGAEREVTVIVQPG